MYKDKIIEIIKKIKGSYFFYDTNFITDGLISSFELIELISELETHFDVKIPYERLRPEDFDSIEAISGLLERYVQ